MTDSAENRYAVVTGANKGIGFEICKQLASNGVKVVLTSRDEKRGFDALEKFEGTDFSHLVIFHQLDVVDPASVASLAQFVQNQFGKLDILVNNAGIGGVVLDEEAFRASREANGLQMGLQTMLSESHESVVQLFKPCKFSISICVIVDFCMFQDLKNEWAKEILCNVENLTEAKIDEVLDEYLNDFKDGLLETKRWPTTLSSYVISKAAMNGYTRILAKKYTSLFINCVCPGFVKTDINYNTGILSVQDGAETPVKIALSPHGGPSGCFFDRNGVTSFE